jgi:hypothetical protein
VQIKYPVVALESGEEAKVSVWIKSKIYSYKERIIGRFLFGRQKREEL